MFKVGQVVWCKKKYTYSITDYHVKCKVVRVFETNNTIGVKVIEGRRDCCVYPVDGDYFELVNKGAVVV